MKCKGKEFKDVLIETAKVTRGRIGAREVYRDFIAYCALIISIPTDPIHREMREKQLSELEQRYSQEERAVFASALKQMTELVSLNIRRGTYKDILSQPFFDLGAHNKALKQDFTPPDVSSVIAGLIMKKGMELPEKGYITLSDPTCGGSILPLAAAENMSMLGHNPSEELVVQVVDMDLTCVQMSYIHLSLYGIPAVVLRGNTLTLEEFDRWYTPIYIWRDWVWREPLPLRPGMVEDNELLKMFSQPMYGMIRQIEWAERKGDAS